MHVDGLRSSRTSDQTFVAHWLWQVVASFAIAVPFSTATTSGTEPGLESITEWANEWRDVACAKLLWDLEVPSYDVVGGVWKMGRTAGSYAARWPDGYVVDLSDSAMRPPFSPSDVDSSDALKRIRATIHRQIRQPDGTAMAVSVNAANRGAMLLDRLPNLEERPEALIGASPPVVAWWVASRLGQAGAIAVSAAEDGRIEFEMLELKSSAEIRRVPRENGWYLSKIVRYNTLGKQWWSARFSAPQRFGHRMHFLGTVRDVEVETQKAVSATGDIPAAPRIRQDVLLAAELSATCSDVDFIQDRTGLTISSSATRPPAAVETEAQRLMQNAFTNSKIKSQVSLEDPDTQGQAGRWWILALAGLACVTIGFIVRGKLTVPSRASV